MSFSFKIEGFNYININYILPTKTLHQRRWSVLVVGRRDISCAPAQRRAKGSVPLRTHRRRRDEGIHPQPRRFCSGPLWVSPLETPSPVTPTLTVPVITETTVNAMSSAVPSELQAPLTINPNPRN